MATRTNKKETTQIAESESVTVETQSKTAVRSKYSVDELSSKARELFNVAPYVVSAALNKEREYTVNEAKIAVDKFAKKEVKI